MLNNSAFFKVLDDIAPLSISHRLIEKGDYDNSGFLINCHENVKKVLFSLDLSDDAVKMAKRLKCDTIVTHHPAIYKPISSLSFNGDTSFIVDAIKQNLNVISMHLNLDMVNGGIDACLAEALGAKKYKIIEPLDEDCGYGREFEIENLTFDEFIKRAKRNLKTSKVVVYGKRSDILKKGASFCGGGASSAENAVKNALTDADVIITSDMAHHGIKLLLEKGKKVLLITHYSAENYGFKRFFDRVNSALNGMVQTVYFEDKRFL